MAGRSVISALKKTQIAEYLEIPIQREHSPVTINSNVSVEKALKVLNEHRILSAPVRDEDSGDLIGLVDMLDIISFVLKIVSRHEDVTCDPDKADYTSWMDDSEHLREKGRLLKSEKILNIINSSKSDPFFPVNDVGTLYQVVEDVFQRGIQRVPVLDSNKHIVNVISQFDIIKFLTIHVDKHSEMLNKTVQELKLGSQDFTKMDITGLAIHGFCLISKHKHLGVPVVSPRNGTILANLSAADLQVDSGNIIDLLKPVFEFIGSDVKTSDQDAINYKGLRMPPSIVTPKTDLGTVLEKMTLHHIHQLYVVNDVLKPTGIITTTDIMKLFARVSDKGEIEE
ncbi:hypothetical protein BKA69DRAFT_1121421 [Paraphysoderma sedebokerense]|nr:hypothetical protein BKA69DRAFT_1121421 [Paraphysoderma sedebokerense]